MRFALRLSASFSVQNSTLSGRLPFRFPLRDTYEGYHQLTIWVPVRACVRISVRLLFGIPIRVTKGY